MIKLLVPLGLLGLLSILVLILIYIIRPNYQTKYISSTQIWIESLKYRKRRIHTNNLRNILIFICQVLILTTIALTLAEPVHNNNGKTSDVFIIIDSSASMMTEFNDETRFERALTAAENRIVDIAKSDSKNRSKICVAIAGEETTFLGDGRTQYDSKTSSELISELRRIKNDPASMCSWGSMDIDKTLENCRSMMSPTNKTTVYVYTDVKYNSGVPDNVKIMNSDVMAEGEWNMAILDAYTQKSDNYYSLYVDAACYGLDRMLNIDVTVTLPDLNERTFTCEGELFSDGVTKHIIFYYSADDNEDEQIKDSAYTYIPIATEDRFDKFESISIKVSAADGKTDSFESDDTFCVYGGNPEVIKILYVSDDPCRFFQSALAEVEKHRKNKFEIQFSQINPKREKDKDITSGYDFYIYENALGDVKVSTLPADGVSLFFEPQRLPAGMGIEVLGVSPEDTAAVPTINKSLDEGIKSDLLWNVNFEKLTVRRYSALMVDSRDKNGLTVLYECDKQPAVIVRKDNKFNYAVVSFTPHYSNLGRVPDWSLFMMNLFDWYFPGTLDKNQFEINEAITINSRAQTVVLSKKLDGDEGEDYTEGEKIEEFPYITRFSEPGTYRISQTSYYGIPINDIKFYVRMPQLESMIFLEQDSFPLFFTNEYDPENYGYLWVWLAAILVALLFVEWIMHSLENR